MSRLRVTSMDGSTWFTENLEHQDLLNAIRGTGSKGGFVEFTGVRVEGEGGDRYRVVVPTACLCCVEEKI